MLYYNARVFTPAGYISGGFEVENGRFLKILSGVLSGAGIDLGGAKVIPGLVDIHTHGNSERDFSDADPNGLEIMGRYLAANGITSFLPTSVTLPYAALEDAFQSAAQLYDSKPKGCSRVLGVRMEGPFFSPKRNGAQNKAFLRLPDEDVFRTLYQRCGGLIRIVDLAPELPGAMEFVRHARALTTVSVGHTDADYDTASAAFDAGCTHLTHLYNAMQPIHHRSPGVIGAASEREQVTAELICDGVHVHPAAVRMAFRLFPGRLCLVSDALRCCGMPDGVYDLGGQTVYLKNNAARLADGTLAGSSSNLFQCLRNAIRFGISEEEAIRAATIVPAHVIGASDQIGSIEAGKLADFVVCDDQLQIQQVFIGNVCVRS